MDHACKYLTPCIKARLCISTPQSYNRDHSASRSELTSLQSLDWKAYAEGKKEPSGTSVNTSDLTPSQQRDHDELETRHTYMDPWQRKYDEAYSDWKLDNDSAWEKPSNLIGLARVLDQKDEEMAENEAGVMTA